jgi:hypothetical protein
VNTVMNLQVPLIAGKFSSSCTIGKFEEGLSSMSESLEHSRVHVHQNVTNISVLAK